MVRGGILRDNPSPSSYRQPSSVRVIDTTTLCQEEANDDVFREIDEYPAKPIAPNLFTAKHRPFDTLLATKGGGQMSKNFLADARPNKFHSNIFNGKWFFIRGGMGPRVPIRWTALKEVGSLFVRDSTFIKSQIQALREAIPVNPSWNAYYEESALILTGLIHDKMYNPRSNPPVTWGTNVISAFLYSSSSTNSFPLVSFS
ncbi:hypothetical protein LIER_27864 [Lithospermum erythrorhizon]|uniref:Uncharacterized protein n=1 Tax=Lithospermum erythrorhizon TaxID=34254 RepID=A0AAV3RDJ1_LITER